MIMRSQVVVPVLFYLWSMSCQSVISWTTDRRGTCSAGHPGNITDFGFDKRPCSPIHFNKTECLICSHKDPELYMCYPNKRDLNQVLQDIPNTIRYLIVTINNEWEGHLPFTVAPLDLTQISRMTILERFEVRQRDFSYGQLYPLIYEKDSFKPLSHLKELSFRIPLEDQDLGDIVEPLKSLEVFDISFTRGLSVLNVTKTLGRINKETIRYLCLRTFQLIGGDGYSFQINMNNLTGNENDSLVNLIEIDLSDNSLARIDPGIFQIAPNLKKFDVSGNLLLDSHNVPLILEGLLHPTVEELNFGFQGYVGGTHPINSVRSEFNTQRDHQMLGQSFSQKGYDKSHHFGLQNPFIMHCINKVSSMNISNAMTSSQKLCDFLHCVGLKFKGLPCGLLQPLNETYDFECYLYTSFPLGKNLKKFLFRNIHWEEASIKGLALRDKLCFSKNNLESFIFSSNSKWIKAGKIDYILNHITSVTGLENIKTFVIDRNNLDVTLKFLAAANMDNMELLDLSYNRIHLGKTLQFCKTMTKLTSIDLTSNHLSSIPRLMIANCPHLKNINLSRNNLSDGALANWDLNGTHGLATIDLSYNNFKTIDARFRQQIDKYVRERKFPLTINIHGYQLSCGCQDIDFVKWVTDDHSKLKFWNSEKLTCSGQKGVEFLQRVNLADLTKQCDTSNIVPISIGIGAGAGILLLVCIIFGIVSLRWRIKYYIHQGKKKLRRNFRKEMSEEKNYTYDAFVSYCADDRFWVHEVLMKTLENVYGFKLCIHYRDFPVGGSIIHTVADRMNKSHTIIIVVSDVFMSRRMCQFEIDEAQKQAVDNRKQILLIKLGAISRPLPDISVAFLLDRHTYLDWTDNEKSHKLFWAKLVGHLYDDFEGSSDRCCCPYGARALGYEEL